MPRKKEVIPEYSSEIYNGKEYFSSSDSTLTALTIVTSRYNSDMNAEEQTVCAKGLVIINGKKYFHK